MYSVGGQRRNSSTCSLTQSNTKRIKSIHWFPERWELHTTFQVWESHRVLSLFLQYFRFSGIHIAATLELTSITLFMDSYASTWLVCCPQSPIVIYPTHLSRSILLSSGQFFCSKSTNNPLSNPHSPSTGKCLYSMWDPFQLLFHNDSILKNHHFDKW